MPEAKVKYYITKGIPITQVVIKKSMGGLPLLGILQIIFVIAKIFDKLDWSWFMVFWPIWIFPAIFIGIIVTIVAVIIGCFTLAFIFDLIDKIKRRR